MGVSVSARGTEFGSAAAGRVREPAEAQKALRKALDRISPGRGGAITLAELVEEYLELHQAEPVTIGKLRWLLGKATRPSVRSGSLTCRRRTSTHGA